MQFTKVLSDVARPSGTVLFVDSVYDLDSTGQPTGGGSWLVVPPCRYAIDAMTHRSIDTFVNSSKRGLEVFAPSNGWVGDDITSGQKFGGAWPRHQGHMNVGFVDGHVKAITTDQLAAGCDLQPDWSGLIKDYQTYLWNVN